MEKILEVKNLNVSFHTYAGEVKAVRNVSFHLNKGETLAIVGESGCGKSVTSKAIMRLLSTPPAEIKKGSSVTFEGKELLTLSEKEMRPYRGSEISMIFQDPMTSLNPTMQIGKQIAESLIIHRGMTKKDAMNEAIKMLKLVNVPNPEKRVKQYPHEFSGGMRQRAMIAIALACSPKVLIADEPTTALDVTIQAQIMDLISDLQKKLGTAVILVTHDLGVVADVADRIQVMYAGEIIERGTIEEIFYNPQHPYTIALLQSVPRLDTEHKGNLYALGGTPPDLIAPPKGCGFAARCKYCMKVCRELAPTPENLSNTHEVACWLKHPYAPKIDIAESLRKEGV
ncbi:MAG: ABC transporter ATP-binding protein [Clostridium sp.]